MKSTTLFGGCGCVHVCVITDVYKRGTQASVCYIFLGKKDKSINNIKVENSATHMFTAA